MKPDLVWQAALGEFQLQMTQAIFDTWLRDSRLLSYQDGTFIIGVKNGYAKDWLENRLLTTIKRTLARLVGHAVEVRFAVWNRQPGPQAEVSLLSGAGSCATPEPAGDTARSFGCLNPRYTFDTFVVGPSNRLAHAASLAVTEAPADVYNPLFLYGGVGLGKTHLLHAIGHACRARGLNVLYVSSEDFTNDLIEAIRARATDDFRDKYRTTGVLLVDDIQFIAGKESTQEEFFHTFNTLHGTGKQLVMSSDRSPKAMVTLEERLRSRFEWGLIADIQPPDLETRIAILRFKAEARGTQVPDDVFYLIAGRVQSNIRELEGALNKVLALPHLTREPLTAELAEAALADLLPHRTTLTLEEVIEQVADFYGLEVEALCSPLRSRAVARPRQMAMYLAREEAGASLPQIGAALGGRDHTTVLYGCERIADLLEKDRTLQRELLALRERLHREGVKA